MLDVGIELIVADGGAHVWHGGRRVVGVVVGAGILVVGGQRLEIDFRSVRRGEDLFVGRHPLRRPLDGRNDERHAALRALALHAHVGFIPFEQMPLRAQKLKRHFG